MKHIKGEYGKPLKKQSKKLEKEYLRVDGLIEDAVTN